MYVYIYIYICIYLYIKYKICNKKNNFIKIKIEYIYFRLHIINKF